MGAIVEAVDLVKVYETRGVSTRALDGVSFEVAEGEFTALAGPSGSGKTTLLNIIGALDVPSSGKISVAGASLSGLTPKQLSDLRERW